MNAIEKLNKRLIQPLPESVPVVSYLPDLQTFYDLRAQLMLCHRIPVAMVVGESTAQRIKNDPTPWLTSVIQPLMPVGDQACPFMRFGVWEVWESWWLDDPLLHQFTTFCDFAVLDHNDGWAFYKLES